MPRRPFNDPFGKLGLERLPRPASPPEKAPEGGEASDQDLWTQAVAGARPLAEREKVVAPGQPRRAGGFQHPDLEALQALEALVSGEAPFDIADTDEYVEGHVSGLDAGIVRRLRRGDYAIQGHIDLHGLTRLEAKRAVAGFLRESRRRGHRCVLVVHGRGSHSQDQVPVLKEALRSWLASARFGRHVLAFATARPQDGGAGAVYLLLRRPGR